jgi:class 3 adenylate cyclase
MGLKDDLIKEVTLTFKSQWKEQETTAVPDPEDLNLNSNDARDLKYATVLYADLDGSTSMVDSQDWHFSAEVYKAYLLCASEIIRAEGGAITGYDAIVSWQSLSASKKTHPLCVAHSRSILPHIT